MCEKHTQKYTQAQKNTRTETSTQKHTHVQFMTVPRVTHACVLPDVAAGVDVTLFNLPLQDDNLLLHGLLPGL